MHPKLIIFIFIVFSKSLLADCWSCYELYEAIVITNNNKEYTGILSLNDGQKESYVHANRNKTPLDASSFFNSNYFPKGYITLRNDLIVINKTDLGIVGGFFRHYIVRDGRKDISIQIKDIKSVNIIRNTDHPHVGINAREISYYDDNHPFNTSSIPTQVISIDSDYDYATLLFLNFGSPYKNFNNEVMKILGVNNKEELFSAFSYESSAKSTRVLYENNIIIVSESGN